MLGWVDAARLLIEKGATIGLSRMLCANQFPVIHLTQPLTHPASDAINFQGQNALMVAAEFNNEQGE